MQPSVPVRSRDAAAPRGHTAAPDPEAVFRSALARQGQKLTGERKEILKAAFETHEHFDADRLYLLLRNRGVKTSKATVYRALALLRECGLLRVVFQGPHGASYEHVFGHAHHEHMVCLSCSKVIEFSSRRLEELQEDACRAHSFKPVRHYLQVFGYCKDCQKPGSH